MLFSRPALEGLVLATLLALLDLADHTLGPVSIPATDVLIVAPLVTAARTDGLRTGIVGAYAVLLALIFGPLHPVARTADELVVVTVVAACSAGAVWVAHVRCKAERSERQRTRELEQVQSVTDAALEQVGMHELLPELLMRITESVEADSATFLLMEVDGRRLVCRSVAGVDSHESTGGEVQVGVGFAGKVAAEAKPLSIRDWNEAGHPPSDPTLPRNELRSLLGVPLMAEGRVTGVLQVGTRAPRAFSTQEVKILQLAADRAALAIERCRLHEREREIARELQEGLLPHATASIPGVEVSSVYRAAGEGQAIGGDFFDLFEIGNSGQAVLLGDIAGKGPAAAATTALARYSAREAAAHDSRPGAVLSRLNQAFRSQRAPGDICTAVYGVFEWRDEALEVTLSVAGHPPPLVLNRQGEVAPVGRPGPPIGAVPAPFYSEQSISLERGDTLLLYTDGASEVKTAGGLLGVEGVARLLERCHGLDGRSALGAIEADLRRCDMGDRQDDLILLVLRVGRRVSPTVSSDANGLLSHTQGAP